MACMGRDVYLEGVECVFMLRGRVCIWKCACMGRGGCVYGRVECVCMVASFPGPTQLSIAYSMVKLGGPCEQGYMDGERVCAYGRVKCACIKRGCEHMAGVECVCMGMGRVCAYGYG